MRLRLLLLSSLLLSLPMPVLADTVYTYTGNPYSSAVGQFNPFNLTESVSGSFTVSAPLAPNMPLSNITPNQFSFSDGHDTISDTTGGYNIFKVATDGSGDITSWVIRLFGNEQDGLDTLNLPGETFDDGGVTYGSGWGASSYSGYNLNDPGTWAGPPPVDPSPSAVPEPSSLLMLGTGALGLAGTFRKRLIGA